jgi:hypothetical protein
MGAGRRGDGSDGHSWAGGLGAILDLSGDDRYVAGNFSQGVGYWFGTGVMYDGSGDDRYESVYFTQASGAHFCVGALIDEAGDDVHVLSETAGAGLGFGWDWTNALLLDRSGNDRYEAERISIGCSQIRSQVYFVEGGGDDVYVIPEKGCAFGASPTRPDYLRPDPLAPYMHEGSSVGVFLDLGGTDSYPDTHTAREGGRWWNPEPAKAGPRNLGVGADREGGRVPELDRY